MSNDTFWGEMFSVVRVFSLPQTNPLQIAFENPVGNSKTMYLENVAAGVMLDNPTLPQNAEANLAVDISRVNSVTPGAVLTAANLNLGSQEPSTLRISLPANYSGVGALSVTRHPTGEFNLDFEGRIVVPPGRNLLITVSPNSSPVRGGTVSVTVLWYES